MKRLLLGLMLTASLAGCGVDGAIVITTAPPGAVTPDYVYTYADGSCWANAWLYTPCPWVFGGGAGFYHIESGRWYRHDNYRWDDRFHPPPRWHAPEHYHNAPVPAPGWRSAPPRGNPGFHGHPHGGF